MIAALSRQSPLIAHERVGLAGRPLRVLKFRTMWPSEYSSKAIFVEHLPPSSAPSTAPKGHDARVTSRLAAFCRRYSVDELPQLWNVLRGDMALVGPRPLTRVELDRYYGRQAARILEVLPGLTGLWQIRGRSRLSYQERCRLDLIMIRKWSIALYLKILLATVPCVITGKDAC